MTKKILLFLVSFNTWALLNWPPDWQHVLIGSLASIFVVYMVGDLYFPLPEKFKDSERYMYFLFPYLPVLIWQIIKSNIDVAWRIMHPGLPIHPGIVKVRTTLKTDVALTFLANSITLTPGTMVVDIDRENGILYVHWVDVKTHDPEEATAIIVGRFEKILKRIFE